CPLCGRSFARPPALHTHIFAHSGEQPHSCSKYKRRFNVHSNLRRHMKSLH
ncbi:hypothetical protein BT69DRAFT_1184216, partial [Atractiella rhizophila]